MQSQTNYDKSRLHEYNTLYYLLDGDMTKFLNSAEALNFEKTSYLFSPKVMITEMNRAFKASVIIKEYLLKMKFGKVNEGYVCSVPVGQASIFDVHSTTRYRDNSNPADIVIHSDTQSLGISLKSISHQKAFINHKVATSAMVPGINANDYDGRDTFIMGLYLHFDTMNKSALAATMQDILHMFDPLSPTVEVANVKDSVYIGQMPSTIKTVKFELSQTRKAINVTINGKFEYKIYAYRLNGGNVKWALDLRKKIK